MVHLFPWINTCLAPRSLMFLSPLMVRTMEEFRLSERCSCVVNHRRESACSLGYACWMRASVSERLWAVLMLCSTSLVMEVPATALPLMALETMARYGSYWVALICGAV